MTSRARWLQVALVVVGAGGCLLGGCTASESGANQNGKGMVDAPIATVDAPGARKDAAVPNGGDARGAPGDAADPGGPDAAVAADDGPVAAAPTWHEHVWPIVSQHCTGCHRAGGIAPFALTSYEAAKSVAPAIAPAISSGYMPPWHARDTDECRPRYQWKNDLRLSAEKKTTLVRWAESGAPEGDPGKAVTVPPARAPELSNRNVRTTMAKAYPVEGNRDLFRCFPLPHVFDKDVWLTGVGVVPGNTKVVHHVLVWLDSKRQSDALAGTEGNYQCFGAPGFSANMVGAWAPGAVPFEPPAGAGVKVPKGSRIVINVHYHPGAGKEIDTSSIDLRWTETPPAYEALLTLPGNAAGAAQGLQPGAADPPAGPAFVIPANARDHVEAMQIAVPANILVPVRIFGVGTHMHYVGVDMKMEIDRSKRTLGAPAGEPAKECLIQTPAWDFHWQRGYEYDTPVDKLPTVAAGDRLLLRCRYDNSMQNPHVVQALTEQGLKAPRDVRLGEQTLDEMCLGVVAVIFPRLP